MHAQDKAVMRARLDRARRAQPAAPRGRRRRRGVAFAASSAASRACSRPPAAGTTARACGSSRPADECADAFAAAAPTGVQILAEERVDFRRELSALVARSP